MYHIQILQIYNNFEYQVVSSVCRRLYLSEKSNRSNVTART
ncbi:hypothetical protein OTSANNIE_0894 [Anaplasma phagocytophilum str. Annie]|nr:hypothetical protein OTSANNIE_0894 [Anaplasma phagocytophilum str. Annie]